jgi:exonuclease III
MIYASWNIRGIQAEGRKTAIIDTFSRIKPNIIGFQETKKGSVLDSYLKSLVANRLFSWFSLPAKVSVGGILVGVDLDMFDIIS